MTEDKKEKKLFSFDIEVVLYSTPEIVFISMTDESTLQKWIEGKAIFECKLNGLVNLFDGWVIGEVLDFDSGVSLTYTWKPNTWHKNFLASIVHMEFEEHEAGTLLKLSHRGFPTEKEANDHREGWTNYFFDPLNDYFTEQL